MVERLRHGGVAQLAPRLVVGGLVVFAVLYVLVIANPPPEIVFGDWRTTTFGSAVDDPGSFLQILLDAVTFAGLLFIVASGFSLIFGLMRVLNMATGLSTSWPARQSGRFGAFAPTAPTDGV